MTNHMSKIPPPRTRTSDKFLVRLHNTPEGHASYKKRLARFTPEVVYDSGDLVRTTTLKKVYRARGKYKRGFGWTDGYCPKAVATHFDVYVYERSTWRQQ